jgi:FHA domain-containing protein
MLLEPPARGFLAGPAALQAALDDLQSHQAGMAAGMRSVLTSVLGRLDPVKLGLAPRRRWWLNFLRPRRKATLWDKYVKQYESLREEIQGDFERVFGEVFRETYEAKAPLRK